MDVVMSKARDRRLRQDRDDLFLAESRLPHVRLLVDGLSFQMRDKSELRSSDMNDRRGVCDV
jgi:hypothetical protein